RTSSSTATGARKRSLARRSSCPRCRAIRRGSPFGRLFEPHLRGLGARGERQKGRSRKALVPRLGKPSVAGLRVRAGGGIVAPCVDRGHVEAAVAARGEGAPRDACVVGRLVGAGVEAGVVA